MRGTVVALGLLLAVTLAHGQQSTDLYIPIGQYDFASQFVGRVVEVDRLMGEVTIDITSLPRDVEHLVGVRLADLLIAGAGQPSRIFVDKGASFKTDRFRYGTLDDLKVGLRAEVKLSNAGALWLKIALEED